MMREFEFSQRTTNPDRRRKALYAGLIIVGILGALAALNWWRNRGRVEITNGGGAVSEDLLAAATMSALLTSIVAQETAFAPASATLEPLALATPSFPADNVVPVEGMGCWQIGKGRNGERFYYLDGDKSTSKGLDCDGGIWSGYIEEDGVMKFVRLAAPNIPTPVGGGRVTIFDP